MYIKVTVFPDFKKELVEKLPPPLTPPQAGGELIHYKMYIRQPAERGQANKRVLEILQKDFPGKRIRIVNGALTMKKLIEVK
jgi:uncharacterized protein YggU (UPF0235/DUF167 family)